MKASDLLNQVFHCAIEDMDALADAWGHDTPEGKDALKTVERFKGLRQKLLPGKTPAGIKTILHKLDASSAGLDELIKLHQKQKP